tara:strand:- start:148 stop:465 length:318 start_codon:yes stop_codon:yes gene_type:complete
MNDITVTEVISAEEYDDTMKQIASSDTSAKLLTRRELSRADVVYAFQSCFENLGGVPRMAMWADENPGDFYKLYARLLPSQASSVLGEKNEFVIKHVLPRGALDE